jgi:hypothetical protein
MLSCLVQDSRLDPHIGSRTHPLDVKPPKPYLDLPGDFSRAVSIRIDMMFERFVMAASCIQKLREPFRIFPGQKRPGLLQCLDSLENGFRGCLEANQVSGVCDSSTGLRVEERPAAKRQDPRPPVENLFEGLPFAPAEPGFALRRENLRDGHPGTGRD